MIRWDAAQGTSLRRDLEKQKSSTYERLPKAPFRCKLDCYDCEYYADCDPQNTIARNESHAVGFQRDDSGVFNHPEPQLLPPIQTTEQALHQIGAIYESWLTGEFEDVGMDDSYVLREIAMVLFSQIGLRVTP